MAAKRTSDLIPLCHQINLTSVDVAFELERVATDQAGGWVKVCATAECVGGTGVEVRLTIPMFCPLIVPADLFPSATRQMEALTSVSVALLTVWDMVKAVAGKEMVIEDVKVTAKSGGKTGVWRRDP